MASTSEDVSLYEAAPARIEWTADSPGRHPAGTWRAEAAVVALVALTVRLIQLDHAPWVDELFHMLAARSLITDGTLHINGTVEYTRAWVFTWLLAGLARIFGESLVVARIPAVLAGTALVTGLFVWLYRLSGRWAAWSAALLLCFSPISIYLSQQARFYTLHALLFGMGALAVLYAAAERRRSQRIWLFLVGALCFALALRLQITTLIGLGAVGIWLLADRTPELIGWVRGDQRRRFPILLAFGLTALALLTLFGIGFAPRALALFTRADSWAEANRNYVLFYHDMFVAQYPTLWPLFPVAFLIAATRYLRAALFLAVIVGVVVLFHSLAAWKHERYVFYVLPAFFALWGLAAAVALPWLHARLVAWLRPFTRRARPVAGVLLGAALIFATLSNQAIVTAWRVITVDDADWTMSAAYRGEGDWQRAMPVIAPEAQTADVVLASSMMKALFFLDRLDVGMSVNEMQRLQGEFDVAAREGVPVITRVESLMRVHGCYAAGLVIVEERDWARPWKVPVAVTAYIQQNMELVQVPRGSGIRVHRWNGRADVASADCPALYDLVSTAGRRARRAATLTGAPAE